MDFVGKNLRDFLTANGHLALKRAGRDVLRTFTEKEIEQITFGYSILLGKGAFGEVYRGVLDGKRPVAVKRYKNRTWKKEFAREVIVHSKINHKNVVRLLGCCTEENALMIVMEFICNGNLENLLHYSNTNGRISLPLDKRLDIAIVTAEVLAYMHSMYSPVLHGDIKSANILLDESFMPKISDFGIARLLSSDEDQHTRYIIGCRGYVDPIYCQSGILTPKSDVYSFGVVLLEIISRKKAIEGNSTLVQSFIEALRGEKVTQLFDKEIADTKNMKFLLEIGKLAAKCLELDVKMRPEMSDVADGLRMVRRVLQLEQEIPSGYTKSPVPNKLILVKKSPSAPQVFGDLKPFTQQEMEHITRNYGMIYREEFNEILYNGVVGKNSAVIIRDLPIFSQTERERILLSMRNLRQRKHRNVANVIGYHLGNQRWQCVYESSSDISQWNDGSISFTSRNLYETICSRKRIPLHLRLSILVQCAEGLIHIHSLLGENPHSYGSDLFGNFRSANILLYHNSVPKVFNPNLSTFLGVSVQKENTSAYRLYSQGPKIDYSDPMYVAGLPFNPKSDVYSFGVVLLELITWKPAKYLSSGKPRELTTDFLEAYRIGNHAMDIFFKDFNEHEGCFLQELSKIAVECLHLDRRKRPEMTDVHSRLQLIAEKLSFRSKLTAPVKPIASGTQQPAKHCTTKVTVAPYPKSGPGKLIADAPKDVVKLPILIEKEPNNGKRPVPREGWKEENHEERYLLLGTLKEQVGQSSKQAEHGRQEKPKGTQTCLAKCSTQNHQKQTPQVIADAGPPELPVGFSYPQQAELVETIENKHFGKDKIPSVIAITSQGPVVDVEPGVNLTPAATEKDSGSTGREVLEDFATKEKHMPLEVKTPSGHTHRSSSFKHRVHVKLTDKSYLSR